MKQLIDFIYEQDNRIFNTYCGSQFSSNMTLQESYEDIFDMMFAVNEGLFSTIGKKLAEWGAKAAKGGENIDKRISNATDSAKNAIKSAKKKAGKVWKKVKDTYASVVLAIDDAIKASQESIVQLCKQSKMKIDEFTARCATIYSNAMAQSSEIADALQKWVSDKTKGAQKFAALNTLLMGAMLANKAGVESSMAIEVLSMAGFK